MTRGWLIALGVLFVTVSCCTVHAADHADGPAAAADPSADITDVFAWMSPDATKLYLAMDLVRDATAASKFSDSVQYVFHTTSREKFGSAPVPEVDIICVFNPSQIVQCWVGSREYVTGDASIPSGITSRDGHVRVFTGLRNDPFFFNLAGFKQTGADVADAASSLTFDPAGCPQLDGATSTALVTQLQTAPGGGAPVDNFAHFNVLAIVLALDQSLVTQGGPIFSMWGSTNRQ